MPSVTQTTPSLVVTAVGAPPIAMVRRACRDETSTRVTLLSSRFATHNAPAPDAIATGRAPTGTVALIEPDGSRATIEFAATVVCLPPPSVAKKAATTAAASTTVTAAATTRLRDRGRGTATRFGSSNAGATPVCATGVSSSPR